MIGSAGAEWWRPAAPAGSTQAGTAAVPAKESPVPFVALLLFLVLLLLAPQAFVPGVGRVRIALFTGAFALAVFWLLSNTITTLPRLRMVAWTLSLTAVPMAATGVWNFLSHRMAQGRIVGYDAPMVVNPNDLALVLNLILPLTVALFLISRRPVARGLLGGLIALDASAIVLTFSRGGFLTLATTIVLYLRTLHSGRELRWVAAALMLAVVAAPLLPSGYLDRLGTITTGKEATLFSCTGDILDIRANVTHMWVAGKEISLENRHTRLYEKYKNRPKP